MPHFFRLCLLVALLFFCKQLTAQQVCSGSLGDPIAGTGTDFGNGQNDFGPPIISTTYKYVSRSPEDGEYTLAKTINGLNRGWQPEIRNHTPDDPDGYMMVVNASYTKDIFYKANVNNLCANTKYEFAAYLINLLRRNDGINPNVTFAIYDSNRNLLAPKYSTGDILAAGPTDWKQYALIFTTPSNSGPITIELSNENPGGGGNDLALDDITFRACGPTITTKNNNQAPTPIDMCIGESQIINLTAELSDGYFSPAYQWQVSNGSGYLDIPGQNTNAFSVNTNTLPAGNYKFRVRVAEQVNISSLRCGIAGAPILVSIYPKPIAKAELTSTVCVGQEIRLRASGGNSFYWTGPNNFSSTDQNPVILNAQKDRSGTYSVIVSSNGCTSSPATTQANVIDFVVAKTSVAEVTTCPDDVVQLQVTDKEGYTYTWRPTVGLSNPNIPNPIATPTQNITYSVTVSNGFCSVTDTTRIIIAERQIISAGENIKLFAGQTRKLNASVIGKDYTFFWTPIDFLDDPTSLTPTASPPKDITYTLHVVANTGCFDQTSSVFVKVYPEIIIPNAFSPNGDGINDTWAIPAAAAFESAKIKIYNRYGSLVYQKDGLFESWDGKYKGVILPPGVYYYTAYFNNDFKLFSGSVTLIR